MKTAVSLMLVFMLMIVVAPICSAKFVQVYNCSQDEDATDTQIEAAAAEWIKAAKTMKGGDQLELNLYYPVVAKTGEDDLLFVITAPSLEKWGVFMDGYPDSAADKVDQKLKDLIDCPDSALWESVKIK